MKRARFAEEQIIGVLKEVYSWKARYGGLKASEARRLSELESESARLKWLLAEAMLD